MSGASAPLTLKFGADTSGMREAISALAADAPRNFALIAQAAIGSSKQIRRGAGLGRRGRRETIRGANWSASSPI